jgi:hypothetical protein
MQQGYTYYLTQPAGENFHSEFRPEVTPAEMLELGVFGGKYMTDCREEFPEDWFVNTKLATAGHDATLNCFGVSASQSLAEWRRKGWIDDQDPRGWFQWYCRYFRGRRSADDERQVRRWRAIRRHIAQVKKNCEPFQFDCRPRQRQAILQWAYDSRRF